MSAPAALVSESPQSLILTRRDVAALMDRSDWLDAAELAFRALGEGRAHAPEPMAIAAESGAFHAKGASLRLDRLYVALKLNGNFPDSPDRLGLPTIQGAILLCDGENGRLLAVLDSIEVTLRRTAAASALAAQLLARPHSRTALVCGCGRQGIAQLEAVRDVLPLERVLLWDADPQRARRLADAVGGEPAADLPSAARRSDVILCCTSAREPYLDAGFVRQGTFIAAAGADSPRKSEIDPDLMAAARVVTDLTSQCAIMGDLRHGLSAGALGIGDVHAELHEVLLGAAPGRRTDDETFLFDSTGSAIQDVAACVWILERARRRSGILCVGLGG
ncbi:MAG: ornithine cyclodeaminase family protein [Alphaproteobacteria bacterium]